MLYVFVFVFVAEIFKQLILLNDTTLYDELFAQDVMMDLMGVLECKYYCFLFGCYCCCCYC